MGKDSRIASVSLLLKKERNKMYYCLVNRYGRLAEWVQNGSRAPLYFRSKAEALEWKKRVAPRAAHRPKSVTNPSVPYWIYSGGQYGLFTIPMTSPIIHESLTPDQEVKARETWASVGKYLYPNYHQWKAVFLRHRSPDQELDLYPNLQRALEQWQKDHPQATEAETKDAVAALMIQNLAATQTIISPY